MSSSFTPTLYGPEFKQNPYPVYAEMRDRAPVYHGVGEDGQWQVWFVTRHEDVTSVLRDHKRFVKSYRNAATPEALAAEPEPHPLRRMLDQHMLNTDPPDHTRLRSLVSKAFTARRIQEIAPRVQQVADELIDPVFARGRMDLIDAFAFPLPIIVIAEMLGIPAADRDRFRVWSNAFITPTFTEEENMAAFELMQAFVAYLGETFAARRRHPREDMISALIQAEEAGDRLNEEELFSMVVLLIVAGHETTVNLIGNGMLALLQHPQQMAMLVAQPERIPAAVEELLRYDSPVERATMRFATEDVELGGQMIKRGQPLFLILGSANRDERTFSDADRLDISREENRHVAFGLGIHYCVGAPLARLEGEVALRTLLQRLPGLRLAAPVDQLVWNTVPLMHGLSKLPVAWDVTD